MGRGMPRPYNKSNPIVQRMLAANEARKLGKRRGSTVAACRDPIVQVTFNIGNITAAMGRGMPRPYNKSNPIVQVTFNFENILLLEGAACRDRTTKAPPISQATLSKSKFPYPPSLLHAAIELIISLFGARLTHALTRRLFSTVTFVRLIGKGIG